MQSNFHTDSHQGCCKISLYFRKASIVIPLPHTHAWHMLLGIDAVKASNFCLIFDKRCLRVPESHGMMWHGQRAHVQLWGQWGAAAGWVAAGNLYCSLDCSGAALVARSEQQWMPLSGWKTAIWQWMHKLSNLLKSRLLHHNPECYSWVQSDLAVFKIINYYCGKSWVLSWLMRNWNTALFSHTQKCLCRAKQNVF